MKKDLYDLLGVKEGASSDEIKRAYRDLAKRFHPDATGGDKSKEARFKDISAAYEVLSDPDKRRQYDAMRHGGFGPDFFGGPGGGPGGGFGGGGFEELFAQMFGGAPGGPGAGFGAGAPGRGGSWRVRTSRGGRPPVEPSPDVTQDLEITVEEAVLGGRIEVQTPHGPVTLAIPPGTSSGRRLRLRGKGRRGPDGTHGDLYIAVKIIVPERVDEEAAELIRRFARRAPVKPRR